LAAGMDDFISKPISSKALEQLINARLLQQQLTGGT
jgi:CheY-like chemotaxis protein